MRVNDDDLFEACSAVGIARPTPAQLEAVEAILYALVPMGGARSGRSTALSLARELESMGYPERGRR